MDFVDRSGNIVPLDPEEGQRRLLAGEVGTVRGSVVNLVDKDGNFANVDSADVGGALKGNRYRIAHPEEVAAEKARIAKAGAPFDAAGAAAAGAAGLANFIPFGEAALPNVVGAFGALTPGDSFDEAKARTRESLATLREEHPYAHGAGEVAAFLPGVVGAVGKGALKLGARALGMDLAEEAVTKAAPSALARFTLPGVLERVGNLAEHGVERVVGKAADATSVWGAAGRGAAVIGARGAAESAVLGGIGAATTAAIENRDTFTGQALDAAVGEALPDQGFTGNWLATHIVGDALLGAGLGAALGGAGSGVSHVFSPRAVEAAAEAGAEAGEVTLSRAAEYAGKKADDFAVRSVGANTPAMAALQEMEVRTPGVRQRVAEIVRDELPAMVGKKGIAALDGELEREAVLKFADKAGEARGEVLGTLDKHAAELGEYVDVDPMLKAGYRFAEDADKVPFMADAAREMRSVIAEIESKGWSTAAEAKRANALATAATKASDAAAEARAALATLHEEATLAAEKAVDVSAGKATTALDRLSQEAGEARKAHADAMRDVRRSARESVSAGHAEAAGRMSELEVLDQSAGEAQRKLTSTTESIRNAARAEAEASTYSADMSVARASLEARAAELIDAIESRVGVSDATKMVRESQAKAIEAQDRASKLFADAARMPTGEPAGGLVDLATGEPTLAATSMSRARANALGKAGAAAKEARAAERYHREALATLAEKSQKLSRDVTIGPVRVEEASKAYRDAMRDYETHLANTHEAIFNKASGKLAQLETASRKAQLAYEAAAHDFDKLVAKSGRSASEAHESAYNAAKANLDALERRAFAADTAYEKAAAGATALTQGRKAAIEAKAQAILAKQAEKLKKAALLVEKHETAAKTAWEAYDALPKPQIGFEQAQRVVSLLDNRIPWHSPGLNEAKAALKTARTMFADNFAAQADKVAQKFDPTWLATYQKANMDYAAAMWMKDASLGETARQGARRIVGLSEQLTGGVFAKVVSGLAGAAGGVFGGVGGAVAGAAAGMAAAHTLRTRGAQMATAVAHKVSQSALLGGGARVSAQRVAAAARAAAHGERLRVASAPDVDFTKAVSSVRKAAANEAEFARRVTMSVGNAGTEASRAAVDTVMRGVTYLKDKLPPPAPPSLVPGWTQPMASPVQKANFEHAVRGVQDPIGAFERAVAGKGSREEVQAASVVYPIIAERFRRDALAALATRKTPLDYSEMLLFEHLLGIQLVPRDPKKLKAVQDAWVKAIGGGPEDGRAPLPGNVRATAVTGPATRELGRRREVALSGDNL